MKICLMERQCEGGIWGVGGRGAGLVLFGVYVSNLSK